MEKLSKLSRLSKNFQDCQDSGEISETVETTLSNPSRLLSFFDPALVFRFVKFFGLLWSEG